jgi:hypothetical protein
VPGPIFDQGQHEQLGAAFLELAFRQFGRHIFECDIFCSDTVPEIKRCARVAVKEY